MTDLRINRGDNIAFETAVYRFNPSTGLNDPVTASKAWFTAKRNARDTDIDSIIALDSLANPAQVAIGPGYVRIYLDPGDTAGYTPDRWLLYDVQIEESTGNITTVERGTIELIRDITSRINGAPPAPTPPPGTETIPAGGETGDVLRRSTPGQLIWTPPPYVVSGTWRFSTSITAADPGSGYFAFNNTVPSAVSHIYMNRFSFDAIDFGSVQQMTVGQGIRIQDKNDSSIEMRYALTGTPPSQGGWSNVPVVYKEGKGALPANNAQCVVSLIFDMLSGS